MKGRFLAPAILFLLMNVRSLASGVTAQQRTVDRWQSSIRESSELLAAGSYEKSLKIVSRVIDEMVDQLGPGDAETKSFGVVLVHKAMAHAGLGQEREAVWYWHLAVNLYPQLADADLSKYGQAGAFLKNHPLPPWDPHAKKPGVQGTNPRDVMVPRNMTAPRVKKKVEPTFPPGANAFAVSGILIVEVVIDEKGTVSSARVLRALPAPTLSYTALEAVKRWRFEPATENGTPVQAFFTLTVNFKL